MLSKTLQLLAKDLGLDTDENSAYGIYGGYMISLYDQKGRKTVFFNCPFDDPEDDALKSFDVSETIKSKITDYSITDYVIQNMGITVSSTAPLAVFREMTDWMAEILKENDIPGAQVCSRCGEAFSGNKIKKISDGLNHFVCCDGCAFEMLEQKPASPEEDSEPAAKNKSVLSFIMAIIGGILGSAVFIGAYFLLPVESSSASAAATASSSFDAKYLICVLSFLTAALVYFGYRLFSKKKTPAAVFVICLIAFVFVAFSQLSGSIIDYCRNHGREIFGDLSLVLPMHFNVSSYLEPMLIYFGIDVLFAAMSLVIFLFDIFSSKNNTAAKTYTVSQYIKK